MKLIIYNIFYNYIKLEINNFNFNLEIEDTNYYKTHMK